MNEPQSWTYRWSHDVSDRREGWEGTAPRCNTKAAAGDGTGAGVPAAYPSAASYHNTAPLSVQSSVPPRFRVSSVSADELNLGGVDSKWRY